MLQMSRDGMSGSWARGGDQPLQSEWGPLGVTDEYFDSRGKNVAGIINGKLYIYDHNAVVNSGDASYLNNLGFQVASPQEMQQVIDPALNPAGQGSMKEGLLSAAAAVAAMYGAGQFLSPAAGGAVTAPSSIPTWMQPTAGGVADTGFGAGTVPGIMGTPAAGVAAEEAAGGSLMDLMNSPTVKAVGLGGTALTLANSFGGDSGGTDMTGFMGNGPSFGAPAAAELGSGMYGTVPGADGSYSGLPNTGYNVGGTVYDLAGVPNPGTDTGWGSTLGSGAVGGSTVLPNQASSGVLKSLADSLGTTPDALLKALGSGASALLGAIGSGQQMDALKDLATQQMAAEQKRYEEQRDINQTRYTDALTRADAATARGVATQDYAKGVVAPSQARYEASFKPDFTMSNDPGFMDALKSAGKASMYGMSVNGNPAGSPNAWAQTEKDVYDKVAYPALKDWRSTNATTGYGGPFAGAAVGTPGYTAVGAGLSPSGTPSAGANESAAAIGAGSNIYGAIGKGIANVTNPPQTLSDWIAANQNSGSSIFKVA